MPYVIVLVRVRLVQSNIIKPSSYFLNDRCKVVILLLIFFVICVSCHTVLSFPCSLVITCWERADLLALLHVMFSCVFITFTYGVVGQVWYLIVWIPVFCLLPSFMKACKPLKFKFYVLYVILVRK